MIAAKRCRGALSHLPPDIVDAVCRFGAVGGRAAGLSALRRDRVRILNRTLPHCWRDCARLVMAKRIWRSRFVKFAAGHPLPFAAATRASGSAENSSTARDRDRRSRLKRANSCAKRRRRHGVSRGGGRMIASRRSRRVRHLTALPTADRANASFECRPHRQGRSSMVDIERDAPFAPTGKFARRRT